MNIFQQLSLISISFVICTFGAAAASPAVPDDRDRQVLEKFLLQLLADSKFHMTRASTNGATIVLNEKPPEGFISGTQMYHDIGNHFLPSDAERNLHGRNSDPDGNTDSSKLVAASFTNLTFSVGIVVADLTSFKRQRSFRAFEEAHPKARGWVRAYLPGYSADGLRAVVHASVGPSPHGATATAFLEKRDGKWIVVWHRIARYV